MVQSIPEDFQRKLDNFNSSQGGPSRIEVAWAPKLSRWQVFAVPVQDSTHPLARNEVTRKLVRPFPDDSGRSGVMLFTWQEQTGKYLPLCDLLFVSLKLADSFDSKDHFEKSVEEPENKKLAADKKRVRDCIHGAREYWRTLDRLVISTNPSVKSGGDWRHRYR